MEKRENIEINQLETTTGTKKLLHLEILRIIAIFFVIFTHTGNLGFMLFTQKEVGSIQFWIYMFCSVFCKFAVPIYLAVSGAVFLNREPEPLKKLWGKRIFRMIIVLIGISLFRYILINNIYFLNLQNGKEVFKQMYNANVDSHLYFLYAYITFLMALPFLQSMVKSLPDKYFYYMISIAFVLVCIRPLAEYAISHGNLLLNSEVRGAWFLQITFLYPCIGYFLQHRLKITKKKIIFSWMINILILIAVCIMTYNKGINLGSFKSSNCQSFYGCTFLTNTISIFITIRYLFENRKLNSKIEKLIINLGMCTFGIYLFHTTFLYHININKLIQIPLNPMIVCWINCLITLIIAFIVTFVLKKIPIIKKLL